MTTTATSTGTLLTGMFLKEMEQEAQTTRNLLARIPDDQYEFKPHEKSMTIRRLATHIAELPGWVEMTLTTKELDFASNAYDPKPISTTRELLAYFDETLEKGKKALLAANDDQLQEAWTLRNGEKIYSVSPKGEVIRMAFSQIVHHRAQLGVFLRLLNIPLPGSYGPSADEGSM